MKEIATEVFISQTLPHNVSFCGLYHNELKGIIQVGTDRHGKSINECSDTECLCKISMIFPEIVVFGKDTTTFMCPFCYTETSTNNTWGYTTCMIYDEDSTYYGYKLTVYFKEIEDACLFYMEHADKHSKLITLNLNYSQ